jgi:hypothetical protein
MQMKIQNPTLELELEFEYQFEWKSEYEYEYECEPDDLFDLNVMKIQHIQPIMRNEY